MYSLPLTQVGQGPVPTELPKVSQGTRIRYFLSERLAERPPAHQATSPTDLRFPLRAPWVSFYRGPGIGRSGFANIGAAIGEQRQQSLGA